MVLAIVPDVSQEFNAKYEWNIPRPEAHCFPQNRIISQDQSHGDVAHAKGSGQGLWLTAKTIQAAEAHEEGTRAGGGERIRKLLQNLPQTS